MMYGEWIVLWWERWGGSDVVLNGVMMMMMMVMMIVVVVTMTIPLPLTMVLPVPLVYECCGVL